jgi:hypothetical protein
MVHAYDEVETVEVAAVQLLRTTVEVVAVTGTALAHSAVGQVTDMPRTNGCRLNMELVAESALVYQLLHNALSGW